MKTLTYLPVNWVNGLKLTSQHFFANQYCQTEALNREAGRSLTSYNYGLGEVLEGIGDNLEIEISGDTMSTLCVRLKSCNAITKGGLPIVYYDGLYGDEKPCATISESGLQAEDSEYMVLISVDPYHLIPVGEPDPEERGAFASPVCLAEHKTPYRSQKPSQQIFLQPEFFAGGRGMQTREYL